MNDDTNDRISNLTIELAEINEKEINILNKIGCQKEEINKSNNFIEMFQKCLQEQHEMLSKLDNICSQLKLRKDEILSEIQNLNTNSNIKGNHHGMDTNGNMLDNHDGKEIVKDISSTRKRNYRNVDRSELAADVSNETASGQLIDRSDLDNNDSIKPDASTDNHHGYPYPNDVNKSDVVMDLVPDNKQMRAEIVKQGHSAEIRTLKSEHSDETKKLKSEHLAESSGSCKIAKSSRKDEMDGAVKVRTTDRSSAYIETNQNPKKFSLLRFVDVKAIRYFNRILFICCSDGYMELHSGREVKVVQVNTTDDIIDVISLGRFIYAFTIDRMLVHHQSKKIILVSTVTFNSKVLRPVLMMQSQMIIIPCENGEIWQFNCDSHMKKMITRSPIKLQGVLFNNPDGMFLLDQKGNVLYNCYTNQITSLGHVGCRAIYQGVNKHILCQFDNFFSLIDIVGKEMKKINMTSRIKLSSRSSNAYAVLDIDNELSVYKLTHKSGCKLIQKIPVHLHGEISAITILDCAKVWVSIGLHIYEFRF